MEVFSLRLFSVVFAFFFAACASKAPSSGCDIAIVGGGPAGVYMAYKLSGQSKKKLCLFEKEKQLGGRMLDENFVDPETQKTYSIGTGARRVNEVQKEVLELAKELGIEVQIPKSRKQLIHTKTKAASDSDAFVSLFPNLKGPFDKNPDTTREDEVYRLLLEKKDSARNYKSLKSYIEAVAGKEAFAYLRTTSRFHGDFDYEISASNYLETLSKEFQLGTTNLYPVGGMSSFVIAMQKKLIERGVKIYLGEAVTQIENATEQKGYLVKTSQRSLWVQSLVLAVPPSGFDYIQGKLAQELRQSPQYKALLPIPIVVINQQWPSAWWKNFKVWRAWSNVHCVAHTEIPQEAYAAAVKVTRSVYTDDPKCVEYWLKELKANGISSVETKVVEGLELLFKSEFTTENFKLPKPLHTRVHYWPAGWYYVRAGSNFSNGDIARWARDPLQGRSNLMFVGEAYWPDRPGWSEGAYFSVDATLQANFGI